MSPPTFYIPDLAIPLPAASRDAQRSPASSFSSKGARPFELGRLSMSSTVESLPPPYIRDQDEESAVPGYEESQEVHTMARSLFLYGFMFPPFWLLGSLILVIPLTPPESWADKSQEQVQAILASMRVAERRWAWRCVMALSTLIFVVLLIVGSLLLAHHFGRL